MLSFKTTFSLSTFTFIQAPGHQLRAAGRVGAAGAPSFLFRFLRRRSVTLWPHGLPQSFLSASPAVASRKAGEGRPAATAPQQEAGAHGGLGPDADPHHGAALPADVQQGERGWPRPSSEGAWASA